MKKLLVLALVLSMATMANAALTLNLSATDVAPSDIITISITGDGTDAPSAYYLGILGAGSPGAFDIAGASVLYPGNANDIYFEILEGALGDVKDPVVHMEINDIPPVGQASPALLGLLVDGIGLHFDAAGVVTIALFNGNAEEMGRADITISDVPEPVTMGLLALGAMFIRRK